MFSLVALFVGSYAWFLSVRQVTNTNDNFIVSSDDTEATYTIYKYDTTSDSPVHLTGNAIEDFALNQYDVVFKERNKYDPLYVAIEIKGSNLGSSGRFILHLSRDTQYSAMDQDNHLNNYFTSVTKYALCTNSSLQNGIYDSSSVSNTWDNLDTVFYQKDIVNQLTSQMFTSGTSGNYSKQDYLEFTFTYNSNDFVGNSLFVFLYINYDPTLAETYSIEHGLNTHVVGGNINYTLDNDLTSVYLSKE